MEQNTHQTRSPPQKYLVLSVRELKALIKMAHEGNIYPHDYNTIIMELRHSDSKKYVGQLRFTDEFQTQVWSLCDWPREEEE